MIWHKSIKDFTLERNQQLRQCGSVTVIGDGEYAGGIVGSNYGWVNYGRNTGSVSGTNSVGGIAGLNAYGAAGSKIFPTP